MVNINRQEIYLSIYLGEAIEKNILCGGGVTHMSLLWERKLFYLIECKLFTILLVSNKDLIYYVKKHHVPVEGGGEGWSPRHFSAKNVILFASLNVTYIDGRS